MRGKGRTACVCICSIRITPAYAGKSHDTETEACEREDHPRLCGEKTLVFQVAPSIPGSPPPMRGKAYKTLCDMEAMRITPAYAGKSRFVVV